MYFDKSTSRQCARHGASSGTGSRASGSTTQGNSGVCSESDAPSPPIATQKLHSHYQQLFAEIPESHVEENLHLAVPGTAPAIEPEEVEAAVHMLRTNKALGNSWLAPELLRHHKSEMYEMIALVLNAAQQSGPPPNWNRLTLCSVHKKGDRHVAGNYRGIALMSLMPKLSATVALNRVEEVAAAKQLRAATQAGFRKGARLEDNVLIIMSLLQYAQLRRT